MVAELKGVQDAHGDGYLSALMGCESGGMEEIMVDLYADSGAVGSAL